MKLNKIEEGSKISKHQKSAINIIETLCESREKVLKLFDDYSRIASEAKYKTKYGGLKILTPKQILQRLPIALAQVKEGNTSENLSGKSYILCIKNKKLLKKYKQYNEFNKGMKMNTKMNAVFMNLENSKTSDPHRLSLNLRDNIDLRRKNKYIGLSNLSIYYISKNFKKSYKNNTFKICCNNNVEMLIIIVINKIQECCTH